MNRRGILMDIPEKVMMIFFVAFLFLLVYLVVATMNTAVQGEDAFIGTPQTFFADFSARIPTAFDGAIVTVFFGMMLVLIGVSWLLATNGILFVIVLIVTVLSMALAGFLANAWITMTATTALSAAVTNMPMTDFIINWYLVFTIVEAFLMITVFFAKQQREGSL